MQGLTLYASERGAAEGDAQRLVLKTDAGDVGCRLPVALRGGRRPADPRL